MSSRRDGAALVGVGAAACAVCCAGPILGFLAAIGVGTAAGFARFGVVGLLSALTVGVAMYVRRRRRSTACVPGSEVALPLESPRVRISK